MDESINRGFAHSQGQLFKDGVINFFRLIENFYLEGAAQCLLAYTAFSRTTALTESCFNLGPQTRALWAAAEVWDKPAVVAPSLPPPLCKQPPALSCAAPRVPGHGQGNGPAEGAPAMFGEGNQVGGVSLLLLVPAAPRFPFEGAAPPALARPFAKDAHMTQICPNK